MLNLGRDAADIHLSEASMQVKIKGRCRGEGKTYLWVRARLADGCSLAASSVNGSGGMLPCALLPLGLLSKDGWREYVLVVFTLKRRQITVFSEIDAKGIVLSQKRRLIGPLHSTWSSRFNGVLRKDLCAKIRNYDWKGLGRQSIITIDRCVDKNGAWLFRGSIFVSCSNDESAFVKVFDPCGEELDTDIYYLSASSASIEDGPDSPLREVRFSVELPAERAIRGNFCFLAGNIDDPASWCLEALEPHAVKELKEKYWKAFEDAWNDPAYGSWMRRHRITAKRALLQRGTRFDYEPLFSVIVPLYKTPLSFFEEMVESVIDQTYSSWELILVNASPEDTELARLSHAYAQLDDRIKIIEMTGNKGITENTNVGIRESEGDFLCFFDHDDVLEPDILFEYVKALNRNEDIDLLYCDEDKLYPDGHYGTPMFKPDFSIDLLRDNNYVCHMLTVRKSVHEQLETAGKEFDGAQDHNLVLQVAEKGRRIHHVPRVLYHWRISENSTAGNASSKPYATQAGIRAVERHLERMDVQAKVECAHGRAFRYKIEYPLSDEPLVSLIVPTRGGASLQEMLDSVLSRTAYDNFEVVLSVTEECKSEVERLVLSFSDSVQTISIAVSEGEFNYSRAIDAGVEAARGAYYAFMHDDVRVVACDWLEGLLRQCMREDVGAVGPMVCDYDGTIQQAGMFIVDGEVVPSSPGLYKEFPGYVYRPLSTQNLCAVSGVCLMTDKTIFEEVGGLDPVFCKKYGEIDYCFKVRKAGALVVYTPEVVIEHRASMGRGRDCNLSALPAFYREKAAFLDRWADELASGDPYFNRNFSHIASEACTFKLNTEKPVEL